jgi:hypothetical protein
MLPKTGKLLPKGDGRGPFKLTYAAAVAAALRTELGDSHRAIKIVMKWTGASERTAKNWLTGVRGPTGEHLVSLVRHSDAVLEIILQLSGREASLVSVNLAYARSQLAQVLDSIDDLLATEPRQSADR